MGNTSSHQKIGSGSSGNGNTKEGGDSTETGAKLINNHQEQQQFRKRSSVFGGGDTEGEGNPVRPEPLTEQQKEQLRDSWKILEKNIAEVGVITFIR